MAFINPADKGVQVTYPLRPAVVDSTYDVGGQQVSPEPLIDYGHSFGTPFTGPDTHAPLDQPVLNGRPQAHPIQHVAQLITDHANLLRQRLLAAHQHGGFAPQEQAPGVDIETLMAGLPAATKSSSHSHLAALLAKFQGSR